MIRVAKSPNIPQSLLTTKAYDGEDVKQLLLLDQYEKCYLCERKRDTDFEIEHLRSTNNHPELVQDWQNIFMSCRYCNSKKLSYFDDIINPALLNVEDEIEHRIDFSNKKAIFTSDISTTDIQSTIRLLNLLFNGKGSSRKIKEERFFEYAMSEVNRFMALVCDYVLNPTPQTEKAVRMSLNIEQELLGFKYWIIKSNPTLLETFANDIVWNKK